jgi:Lysyl oxidase
MRRTRTLLAGTVAAAVALAGAGVGVAHAATDPPPPLAFIAATPNVSVDRYVDGDYVYLDLDLGVNLIAGKDPFEVRATRKSYADPIVAQRIVVKNGKRTAVTLPAGFVDDFGGFRDFTAITIKDAAGATVKDYVTDFCPNRWSSARTRRDAPAQTPYPTSCAAENPFTLGSVWGIQAGWNATIDGYPRYRPDQPDFDIPVGSYTATVTLNPKYRDYFKIPAADATVQLNLTVQNVDPNAGLAPAEAKTEHGGHGDSGLRPPAKIPASLKAVPKQGPKPDLRSLPAWGISLSQEQDKWYVNFGATVWNAGTSPLLVDGFRQTGTELMDAYQYFFDAQGNEVGSVPAGTMEWDAREGHRHWHFTDFAQYNLLSGDQKLAVKSGKEAFCLANTDAVDYTVPNSKWRPDNTDLSSSCGQNTAVAVREVLDIGNGDTYTQTRPGQSFEITDLPNGTYYIEVKANPANKLSELSTANNSSLREITLGGTPDARTLTVPPVNGIEG